MKVTGFIRYEVGVTCPHCKGYIELNRPPYHVDDDYGHAEDLLGAAVFGTETDPAPWNDLGIEYRCCHCDKRFVLDELEI